MLARLYRADVVTWSVPILAALGILAGMAPVQVRAAESDYVIEISVDGLGATYLQALLAGNQLPNFQRLQSEGTWTHNARCDYDIAATLPDHTCIVTGRGVMGETGHNWTGNTDPPPDATIHSNKGSYVASVFDVAHDNGLRTGLFVSKSKLSLFETSYNSTYGAPDTTGPDNGRDKIDAYVNNGDPTAMFNSFISAMSIDPFNYSLVHFRNPDSAGSWGSTNYNNAVKTVDGYLGSIFNLIDSSPVLKDRTTIILTADHGGFGGSHLYPFERLNYTLPFYVWGAGASANQDLYKINPITRQNPGNAWVNYDEPVQPIRNADGANLALDLLGLVAIPGSTVNAAQNLAVQGSGPRPEEVVAYLAFNEVPIGVRDWTPGLGNTELGFATTVIAGNLSPNSVLGTWDTNDSPRRFREVGCEARTTLETVDLTGFEGVKVAFDAIFKDTTYETGDYFRAVVTNGTESITLADLNATDINGLFKFISFSYPFSAEIPDDWTQATLIISSRTDEYTEGMDVDNIFFTGTRIPEPASVCLLALAGMIAGLRARRRGASFNPVAS
jgi:hypothetical protein